MRKCGYYGNAFHLEVSGMKNNINMLTQILEKHNISIPKGAKKKEGGPSFEDMERFHALVASTVRYPSFIINSGASKHMVSTN